MVENTATAGAVDTLRQIIGNDNVLTDAENLRFFSSDVNREAEPARVVVQPANSQELSEAVRTAVKADLAVIPRGGGMSYTDGYIPKYPDSMIVDLRRINRIVEINTEDMFVTVEPGCTWKELFEALTQKGVRTPYFGPLSGMYATVGGALSQNSLFFGSGLYGSVADSVLGLRIVLVDGSEITTGSAATPYNPSPFFRGYGPDLTGLFLGDTGALGFKVEATLKLIPLPSDTQFASFAYDSFEGVCTAMSEVSRRGLAAECFGFDPYLQGQRLQRAGLVSDLKSLAGVARSGKNLVNGLTEAAKVAVAGRRYMDDVKYSMHVVVEGRNEQETSSRLTEIRSFATEGGEEIKNSLPKVMRGTPFVAPNSMLGPDGERWVPIHGLVPHTRIIPMIQAVHDFFEANEDKIEKFGIEWGYLLSTCGHQAFLVEPMFFWKDARHPYHDRVLEENYLSKLKTFPENKAARAAVAEMRSGLATLFMENGAVHFQIGRTYRYKDGRDPETFKLLETIKNELDPSGRMNPGSLGLGR